MVGRWSLLCKWRLRSHCLWYMVTYKLLVDNWFLIFRHMFWFLVYIYGQLGFLLLQILILSSHFLDIFLSFMIVESYIYIFKFCALERISEELRVWACCRWSQTWTSPRWQWRSSFLFILDFGYWEIWIFYVFLYCSVYKKHILIIFCGDIKYSSIFGHQKLQS
jgi:hypothetical protein